MSRAPHSLAPALSPAMARATRLEYWTIGWTLSIVVVMGLAMGGSAAMKTAWIEDMLSFVPPIVFLVAARMERRAPTARFPLGFQRVNSLAFLLAAGALTGLGAILLGESLLTLAQAEHPTVGSVRLFGREIWLGWVMIAVQVYSIVPPLILGYIKLPLARELQDKVLFTDAQTQKANWLTGLAGIAGVFGIGMGWWWADATAAAIIACDILHDGVRTLRAATAELVDGAPRALDRNAVAADAVALRAALDRAFPGATIALRETGRVIRAQVSGVEPPPRADPADYWPGDPKRAWRFAELSFVPPAGQPPTIVATGADGAR